MTVVVPAPPRVAPGAIGPYKLRVWLRTDDATATTMLLGKAAIDVTPFIYTYSSPTRSNGPRPAG